MNKTFKFALIAFSTSILLGACGGGGSSAPGGSGGTTPPDTSTGGSGGSGGPSEPDLSSLANASGRWLNDQGAWVARWLSPAQGETQSPIWLLSSDGKQLTYLSASLSSSGQLSASGKSFNLDPAVNTVTSVNWTGRLSEQGSVRKVVFPDGTSMTQDAPQSKAVQSEVTGSWSTTLGADIVDLNFTLDSQGVLTGVSTTGCTYAGVVAIRPESFVYDTRVSESCPDKTQVLLNGIASLSADKQRLTFTIMTSDKQYAKALFFTKS